MLRTRVGYAGGQMPSPTYQAIGDHSEALAIDFDPSLISYGDLLEVFFASHNPTRAAFRVQYRSALFYADESQRVTAQAAMERVAQDLGAPLATALEAAGPFTLAEDYHQKYILRSQRTVLAELQAHYPERDGFLQSTAVTRANAFLGGHGSADLARADLSRMGLSETSQEILTRALAH